MEIRLAIDNDMERWDAYLDRFSGIPPMNKYAWKGILENTYRIKTYFFIAFNENGKVAGILPSYAAKDIKSRLNLYSLRFGLMANDDACCNAFFEHVKIFCEENKIASDLITSGYKKIDTDCKETVRKTMILNLSGGEEATWQSLRDKTRNMIRKSIKSGLTADRDPGNIKVFYDIYALNMLEKGIPIHNRDFFENIFRKMGNSAEIVVARTGGKIIGGTIVLYSRNAAIYPYQASLTQFHSYAPNQFMVWEAVKSCISRNIPAIDMGESSEGGHVYDFKLNFGAEPRDIYYYSTRSRKEEGPAGSLSHKKTKPSFSVRVLSKTPVFLRKRLGLWLKPRRRII